MTAPQKRAVVTGVVTLLIGTAVLAAANNVILRPEFDLHAQQMKSEINDVRGIALDILCADHPTHRRCR